MIAPTATRVQQQTRQDVNERIRRQTEMNIAYFREHPEKIDTRLRELDEEWDIERALETGSATLSLIGLTFGMTTSRKWLLLPLVVQGFFLQHALQGWCPPLPFFRALGLRTQKEIESERDALRAIRHESGAQTGGRLPQDPQSVLHDI